MFPVMITPGSLHQRYPISNQQAHFIAECRATIGAILTRKDPRIAVILGPCSIHNLASAMEYAKRVKALSLEVQDHCFLVMRAYIEKPRTLSGWKGFLYDPMLDGSNDITTGLCWSRELLRELADLQVPAAMEFLEPLIAPYIMDLVSWGFIGARTCSSPIHRQLASLLPMPVGFKNSMDGNIEVAIQGVLSAAEHHSFPFLDDSGLITHVISEGNPKGHLVLRGSNSMTNYDTDSIIQAATKIDLMSIRNRLIVDCSHGNSQKEYARQIDVLASIFETIRLHPEAIAGLMLESHLEAGHQFLSEDVASIRPGVSITDACLGWSDTESSILELSSKLISFTHN